MDISNKPTGPERFERPDAHLAARAFMETYRGWNIIVPYVGLAGVVTSARPAFGFSNKIVVMLSNDLDELSPTRTYNHSGQYVTYSGIHFSIEWMGPIK